MRRALLSAVLATAALPAAAGAAPLPASVKVAACSVETHEAAFSARMQQVPGASRMAMRFKLFEQTGPKAIRRVKVPGLRRWRYSKPGVKTFSYRQAFRHLPENASHRVVVNFRWLAADGERGPAREAPLGALPPVRAAAEPGDEDPGDDPDDARRGPLPGAREQHGQSFGELRAGAADGRRQGRGHGHDRLAGPW